MTAVAVHHEINGPAEAPPVVLSSSLGTTLAMWDPQVPTLASRLRVVRYDHRGHGRSPVPDGPYDLADLGEDVLALLDSLEIDRASFCGLSLGGMVGMWLAAHAPDRIARLALLSTSALLGPPSIWTERAAAVRAGGTASIADTMVGRWFTPAFHEKEPDVVAEYRAMLADAPDDGYVAGCGVVERMDLREDLASVTAPTIVIAGAEDPATPPAHAYDIVTRIAGAHLEVVPAAAHLVNVEQSEIVTHYLLQHFAV